MHRLFLHSTRERNKETPHTNFSCLLQKEISGRFSHRKRKFGSCPKQETSFVIPALTFISEFLLLLLFLVGVVSISIDIIQIPFGNTQDILT